MRVTKTFSLDTEADRDILRWLDAQENASAAIREAIRAYQGRGGVTMGDVYQAVKELERMLLSGVRITQADHDSDDDRSEPPDAAAALEKLGL